MIALYRKKTTPTADRVAQELRDWLSAQGLTVLGEEQLRRCVAEGDCAAVDLMIVLGGDGTLLSAARTLNGCEIPMLGVNVGRLGFLTEITLDELCSALRGVLQGDIALEPRSMLTAEVLRQGRCVSQHQVLNDVVLNKGALARISDFEVHVDGRYLTTYRSDGFIVATPTGSTAYNLSAGGPIVVPQLPALVLTPICPHTLTHRPILVPDVSVVETRLLCKNGEVYVTLDGQEGVELELGDVVRVAKSQQRILLVRSPSRDHYQVLRTKLNWGGACGERNSP